MKEPTEIEQQKFWEWCGFKFTRSKDGNYWDGNYWAVDYPNGRPETAVNLHYIYPSLDLNNLFKYAVPRLSPKTLMLESYIVAGGQNFSVAILSEKQGDGLWYGNDPDPALALFWAICELLIGDEEL